MGTPVGMSDGIDVGFTVVADTTGADEDTDTGVALGDDDTDTDTGDSDLIATGKPDGTVGKPVGVDASCLEGGDECPPVGIPVGNTFNNVVSTVGEPVDTESFDVGFTVVADTTGADEDTDTGVALGDDDTDTDTGDKEAVCC